MTDNSNNAGSGDSEGPLDLLQKNPIFAVGIAFLGIYFLSMIAFAQR